MTTHPPCLRGVMKPSSSNVFEKWYNRLAGRVERYREKRRCEQDLLDEINRIVSETKTKIPLVPNYQKRLKGPIQTALEKITELTRRIPGPVALGPDAWGDSPVLGAVFASPQALEQWMDACPTLNEAYARYPASELYGVLVTQFKEKTSFGVAMVGSIVQKDVLQKTVYFESPQVVVAGPDPVSAQKALQHRILVNLFTHELAEIADLKALVEELAQQQDILEIKLSRHRKNNLSGLMDQTERDAREILGDIERKREKIGRHPDSPESHLAHVTEVLTDIDQYLSMTPFVLRLNSLGKRVPIGSQEPYNEVAFAECTYTGDHKRCVTRVKILPR